MPIVLTQSNALRRAASVAACLLVTAAPAADWPRLGGPNGSFVSPETGLARSWPTNGPRVLWSAKVGRGFAGPAVSQGEVFLLDREDNTRDVLRCLDLANGAEKWRLAYDAPGSFPYDGSRNVPTVDTSFVFSAGPFGHLICVDRQSHQRAWTRHLVNDFKDPEIDLDTPPANRAETLDRAQVPTWGLTQAPLLYGDLVIVAPQTRNVGLVAYEKTSGNIRWRSDYIGRNWYSHISPTLMRFAGQDQVIMLAQPSDPEKAPALAPPAIISAVDPSTGRILWTTNTPAPHKIPISQPLQVGEDRLFVSGGYGLGCLMLQVTRTNDTWSAKLLFRAKTAAAHIHSPVLYQDRIYVASSRPQGGSATGLVCLRDDGQLLWQTGPALELNDGAMLFADGMALVMNGRSGHLHLLELLPTGHRVLSQAKVIDGSNLWAPMALSNGKLLVRDHQLLKCLDLLHPAP